MKGSVDESRRLKSCVEKSVCSKVLNDFSPKSSYCCAAVNADGAGDGADGAAGGDGGFGPFVDTSGGKSASVRLRAPAGGCPEGWDIVPLVY
jgi:hypothetical protein